MITWALLSASLGMFTQAPASGAGTSALLETGLSVELGVAGPLAVGPTGLLYVADTANERVLVRLLDGKFEPVAGNGTAGFSGDGGLAVDAELSNVSDMAFGSDGTLYLADDGRVRAVSPDGTITTVAGDGGVRQNVANGTVALSASFGPDLFLAVGPSGALYLSDEAQILVLRNGTLDTVPATMTAGPQTGTLADFGPIGLDSTGSIYVSGCVGWSICQVSPTGMVTNLGYARRSGGNASMLERGPEGAIYGATGPNILRVQNGHLVPAAALLQDFWLNDFAFGPDGTLYADELPGDTGFETQQELVSSQSGHLEVLWQESLSVAVSGAGRPSSFPQECPSSVDLVPSRPIAYSGAAPLLRVSTKTAGVVAQWLASLGLAVCSSEGIRGGGDLARRLARDIDRAPAITSAPAFCAADSNRGVRLSFQGAGRKATTSVAIDITGCGSVWSTGASLQGGAPRRLTVAVREDLRALGPPAWAGPWLPT